MVAWHLWSIAGIGLLILEIITPGFIVACFGVACLITAIASYWIASVKIQIAIFCIINLIVFFGIRPFFLKFLSPSKHSVPTNTDALIGKVGVVTENIDYKMNQGRVKVGGEDWKATSFRQIDIPQGTQVVVKEVSGASLIVDIIEK